MSSKHLLDHSYLLSILDYDPHTGYFTHKKANGKRGKPGARAGSYGPKGYRQLKIKEVNYREHRVAWFYMTGQWPVNQIDHKNKTRDDNRWENLREATNKENQKNASHRIGRSGERGVLEQNGKFIAHLRHDDHTLYLGIFKFKIDAIYTHAHAKAVIDGGFKLSPSTDYIIGQML